MWRSSLWRRGEVAVKHTPTVRDFNGWLTMDQFQVSDQSTYGFGNWFGNTCEDQGRDFWEGDWLWSMATALTGATDCAGAQPFCDHRDLVLIRMLCPQACKCDKATGGQFHSNGCSLGCTQEPSFLDSPCKDFSVDEVENKESWTHFWYLFYSNNYNKGSWLEDNTLMVFAKNGSNGNCSVLTSEPWMLNEFCFHFHNDWVARRPLTAFCPETCGCLQQPRPESPSRSLGLWCPSTCWFSTFLTRGRVEMQMWSGSLEISSSFLQISARPLCWRLNRLNSALSSVVNSPFCIAMVVSPRVWWVGFYHPKEVGFLDRPHIATKNRQKISETLVMFHVGPFPTARRALNFCHVPSSVGIPGHATCEIWPSHRILFFDTEGGNGLACARTACASCLRGI